MDKTLYRKFAGRRRLCKGRLDAAGQPIEWKLSYEEWLDIWMSSGKMHLMGIKRGCYVLSRKNDLGHYEVGNVFVQEHSENVRQSMIGRKMPVEGVKRGAEKRRGVLRNEEQRKRISDSLKGKPVSQETLEKRCKPCTIDGVTIFPSIKAMGATLGWGKNGVRSEFFTYV